MKRSWSCRTRFTTWLDRRKQDGYTDDAGEAYMRYLNVAPADQLTEREHAEKFLSEQFNFQTFPGQQRSTPSAPGSGARAGDDPTGAR